MSTGQDDFEQLRKLLKVKRHEQPPPGYFDRLANSVVYRLENEDASRESSGFGEGWAWLGALRRVLAQNPISAGIFAVCGVMMVAFANSQYLDKYMANSENPALAMVPSVGSKQDVAENKFGSGLKVAAQPVVDTISSVNPVFMNAPDSLLSSLNAQPVSYTFSH